MTETKEKTYFNDVMLKRLRKLGIHKTEPHLLTEDEKKKFARLNIDRDTVTFHRVLDVNDRFLRGV